MESILATFSSILSQFNIYVYIPPPCCRLFQKYILINLEVEVKSNGVRSGKLTSSFIFMNFSVTVDMFQITDLNAFVHEIFFLLTSQHITTGRSRSTCYFFSHHLQLICVLLLLKSSSISGSIF